MCDIPNAPQIIQHPLQACKGTFARQSSFKGWTFSLRISVVHIMTRNESRSHSSTLASIQVLKCLHTQVDGNEGSGNRCWIPKQRWQALAIFEIDIDLMTMGCCQYHCLDDDRLLSQSSRDNFSNITNYPSVYCCNCNNSGTHDFLFKLHTPPRTAGSDSLFLSNFST